LAAFGEIAVTTGPTLSARQQAAIEALMTSPTRADAATKARISERTLRRWLADPAFCRALGRARSRQLEAAALTLARGCEGAASALVEMAAGTVKATAARVAAARSALDLAAVLDERLTLLERIEGFEAKLAEVERGGASGPRSVQ
jgi:hypothetical protein